MLLVVRGVLRINVSGLVGSWTVVMAGHLCLLDLVFLVVDAHERLMQSVDVWLLKSGLCLSVVLAELHSLVSLFHDVVESADV